MNHNGKLKEVTLFNWANATADPEGFTGFIMNPKLRFSAWKSKDMEDALGGLFVEMNYDKRIAEYTKLNQFIVEQGYTIPILQQVGTMVVQSNVDVPWYQSSWIRLSEISKK
jgi:peptide/nickel transport system substrate-binding protein